MYKKIFILVMMFMYLYTLTFNIFIPPGLKVPTPIAFALPLAFLFRNPKNSTFLYGKELFVFLVAAMCLFLFAEENVKNFFVVIIITFSCGLYFNYFVGNDTYRYNTSIAIFIILLVLSSIVMLLNHAYGDVIIALRSVLVGEIVKQTPSGSTPWIFSFGYQLAGLCCFSVIGVNVFKKHWTLRVLVLAIAILLIFFGMNRSALVVFMATGALFCLLYYRFKTIILLAGLFGLSVLFKSSIEDLSTGRKQNILAKNEMNPNEHRSSLMIENLKIIADYPFGVAFSGKDWKDVALHNPAFRIGEEGFITSHNAYLMFITYLGIPLGLLLLWFMYQKIFKVFLFALFHIRKREYAMLIALVFAFMAVSLNSFFHNEWLLAGSGPTLFLYFATLHFYNLHIKNQQAV